MSYDDDDYAAENAYDDARMQQKEDRAYAIPPAIQGYGAENDPRRKVDRDSISQRMDAEDARYREAAARARLEDEYGGGAGDWDH